MRLLPLAAMVSLLTTAWAATPSSAATGAAATAGAKIPAALYTDPAPDKKYPASMHVLHIPSHGVTINGIAYLPPGPGPHPGVLLCHGLPGNEKNLDLAQAIRRAGWTVVSFNYRGSWGSPGTYSFPGGIEDARAVLEYLRAPATAQALRLDPQQIVIIGHSWGGDVTVEVAAQDPALKGAVLISAADMSLAAGMPHDKLVALMDDNRETLAGVTAESMAADLVAHRSDFSFAAAAPHLTKLPMLVLTADDGLAGAADSLVKTIRADGGREVTLVHVATDHGWSDHRIQLETTIVTWLDRRR